jgi:hypothetical protein
VTKARSKVSGESVEDLVIEAVPELRPAEMPMEWDGAVDDYGYDVTPSVAVFASEALPMLGICAIEPERRAKSRVPEPPSPTPRRAGTAGSTSAASSTSGWSPVTASTSSRSTSLQTLTEERWANGAYFTVIRGGCGANRASSFRFPTGSRKPDGMGYQLPLIYQSVTQSQGGVGNSAITANHREVHQHGLASAQ